MRHLATRLAGATILAAASLTLAAPAEAASPFACSSILGTDGLVATVCTTILNDQVNGRLTPFESGIDIDSLTLYKCNKDETSCSALATTTSLMTPSFTAVAGKHYKTCAFIHVQVGPTTIRYYNGCSPYAVA
jgi:hypothetical protein